MPKHAIVLGAGISGLSAAWRLSGNGVKVDVLEAEPFAGGLAGTVRDGNYSLDFGPHSFFSEDQGIVDAVLKLFDNKLQPKSRDVKFYYRGKYIDYPLTVKSVLFDMGFCSGIQASWSFFKSRLFPRKRVAVESEDETVEEWAIASFGEYLYRIFFKPYSEQFWKISCSELSSRCIPTHTRMSFINTLKLLLHKKVSKNKDSLIEREILPTYYPNTGFGEIAERIVKKIEKNHGHVHLACEVVSITELPNKKMLISYKHNGQYKKMEGDYIISTVPLPPLIKMLKAPVPQEVLASAGKLDYQSLVVLGIVTHKKDILNSGYVYQLNKPYNRISEMNNFSSNTSPAEENIITVEITCSKDSTAWAATKEELFDICIGGLAEDGFLGLGDVKQLSLIKAQYAYPIYRKDYAVHLRRIMDYLKTCRSLTTLGRCGEFMYMDIDKCMRRAFDFVDNNIEEFRD
ncbi:FAD-dependent oxidoreductase [bacterium]|nr:FAD-dependent oxidoreductase [bacterium]